MFRIRIAELNIEIEHRYPYSRSFCREFFAEFDTPDLTVTVTDADIAAEREMDIYNSTDAYLECIAIYRKIALQLPRFDALVFHASVLEMDGAAYAFAAHSGTGKSTHTDLWMRVFGERVRIVNGDKPVFRRINGKWQAFGTPWRGKEKLGGNFGAPLAAICFLERGKENSIAPVGDSVAVTRLMDQVLMPRDSEMMDLFFSLLDDLITNTATYLLYCNMLPEAALVSYNGMCKGAMKDDTQ